MISFENTADETIGIELGSSMSRIALLRLNNDEIELVEVSQAPPDVKQLYKTDNNQNQELYDNGLLITSLPADQLLIRIVEIPVTKKRDLEAVARFQVEPLLPFPIEEAVIVTKPLIQGDTTTKMAVYAAHQSAVQQQLEQCEKFSVEPEALSGIPPALHSFIQGYFPSSTECLSLHICDQFTTLVQITPGGSEASHSTPIGYNDFLNAIMEDLNLSKEDAHLYLEKKEGKEGSTPQFQALQDRMSKEVGRTITSISRSIQDQGGKASSSILLSGYAATLTSLTPSLLEKWNLSSLKISSVPEAEDIQLRNFAVPIGLARSALIGSTSSVNLLGSDQLHPRSWRRIFKPLKIVAAALLACTLLLYIFNGQRITKQEHGLKERYSSVLALAGYTPTELERLYRSKNKHLPPLQEGEVLDLHTISPELIASRVQFLDKQIDAAPTSFPLFPNIPRVSDLLVWLDTHPTMVDDEGQPFIVLDSLSYTLVKRPTKNRVREQYQTKVDIEFSSSNPTKARAVHDALIAPNDFIDTKENVKWTSSRGLYKASFFLKDHTAYPR